MSNSDAHRQPSAEPAGESAEDGVLPRATLIAALFREHNRGLVRFLASRLSSEAEAKEVAQEAYVRLLQLDQLKAEGFLRALLYKTAANIAIDRIRRRKLDRESRSVDPFDFGLQERSPEDHLAATEEIAIVSQCLQELSPRCRQAVLLSRLHGLSSAEIAASLQVSTRMVRMYLTEALLLIRDRLDRAHTRRRAGRNKELEDE